MTYEYLCTACGHAWEAEQSISAAPLTTCPHCHAESAKRQVSGGAGFILKGGGWYSDLYGSAPKKAADGEKKAADGDTKTTDSSAAKKDGATDTSTKGTDKGSSGSSSSGSGSTGGSTPTSGAASGSKAAGAPSGA